MNGMNNTANLNCEGISTHNINDAGELETLRSEMKKLKAIIASQQIVNNRMMRNAMDTSISRERKEIRFSIIMAASASLVALALHPLVGIPMWFCLLTVAFMITAIAASIHTLRKHMSINMAEDNLLGVAQKIIAYKKFGNQWLKFSIPFLMLWLALFYKILVDKIQGELLSGAFYGGVIGLIIGSLCGFIQIYKSRKRMNNILKEIEEMKKE